MNGLVMLLISAVVLLAAYLVYGRYLARKWGVDPKRPTPAHEMEDGVDYVPTRPSIVFGHEFASIAGAGPINGPIQAAMFGWLPVLLWILIGGIFFGAVQDFSALYASVKNKGKTIGYIIETYIGKTGKRLFLLFVWLFSILVVAAFADIVAGTFAGFNAAGGKVEANAAVATTSLLFIAAAIGLGFFMRKFKPTGIVSGIVAVVLLTICITLGILLPVYVAKSIWLYVVFAYIFFASITPVWGLLQPRDYLNSFLLVAMIGAAFIGVVFTAPVINIPAFTAFKVGNNYLFPILFVTVACGAVSGFHSLVASGTASKQIDNEKHMLPISFGAMLVESLLAVLALITVGALTVGGKLPEGIVTPPQIFAFAVAGFLTKLGLPANIIFTLITLSVSAFALTSLDSVARVGRLAFQELFTEDLEPGQTGHPFANFLANKYVATIATLFVGYLLAVLGYQTIWPLFGSANQLLAALSLIACSVFLKKTNRQGAMLWGPMFIMLAVTFTALVFTIIQKYGKIGAGSFTFGADGLQLVFAILLLGLGIMVAVSGVKKLTEKAAA
ncbi:carbon starvation protein A [Treponema primitia]|uniref:carbon starvation CstA family protein n=1 Tax=Treponema primitia TaxID=88058 RepID=UPI0002555058|nr:carbon starvation protein A [Treponema primitia]